MISCLWPMLLVASAATPTSTHGAGFPWLVDGSLATWGTMQLNLPNSTLTVNANGVWDTASLFQPNIYQFYPSGFLLVGGEVEFGPHVQLHALLDSGLVIPGSTLQPPLQQAITSDDQSFTAFGKSTAWIRELELVLRYKGFRFGAGKRRHNIGHSLVYNDYAWGIEASLRGDRIDAGPWRADAGLLILPVSLQVQTPRNPFAFVEVAYTPSIFEQVELFAAYFEDRAASLNDVLTSAIAENLIVKNAPTLQAQLTELFLGTRQQLGSTGYLGVSFDLLPATNVGWHGTALLQRGSMKVVQAGDHDLALTLRGWAADTQVSWEVIPYVQMGLLAFAQSGSASPSTAGGTAQYDSYVAVAPFLTYTNLFFSGGINEGLFAGRATASGFNGHGVAGVGLSGSVGGIDGHVEARAVYLAALASSPPPPVAGGGSSYGMEYDVMGVYPATQWLSFGVEADMLQPGDFFPQSTLAWRFLAQAYVYGGT